MLYLAEITDASSNVFLGQTTAMDVAKLSAYAYKAPIPLHS